MALGATLVAFIDHRLMFAVVSVVLLATGAYRCRVRQCGRTAPAPQRVPVDPARELAGDHG